MDNIKNYYDLANAIILQAVEDWRDAVRTLKGKPNNDLAVKTKQSCESFFLSSYFDKLTNVRGDDLLRKLKEQEGIA